MAADPFDTAALRTATLAGWRDSATRAAEDLAAERDLVTVGYRDRLVIELAQNAADAAAAAGVDGEIAVWHDDVGVHVANTGAPLTAQGVAALSALRVSPKPGRSDDAHATVGRFGVGFRAVLTVTDHVRILSTGGGVEFSAERSRADAGRDDVATMRLPYPVADAPRAGFSTEVVLLGAGREVVDEFASTAEELLIDLPALTEIVVDDRRIATPELIEGSGPHARWVVGADATRLHSPTRTDEPLTLPVRVIADLPTTSDRRHLHPEADIALAAQGYAEFVAAQDDPMSLLPPRRPVAGEVDAALRDAVVRQLRSHPWIPGGLRPDRVSVLPDLTDELYALLHDVLVLVPPALSSAPDAARLVELGARSLTAAEIADAVPRDREPGWYAELYDALDAARLNADELGALPVPLADGRVVTGARGALMVSGGSGDLSGVSWARIVHPAAEHPLLDRVGARRIAPLELVADPALRALVERIDWTDGVGDDDLALTEAVLACLADVEPDASMVGWLGALPIPDDKGVLQPADELLAGAAPLRAALVEDHPYGTVDPAFEERYGAAVLRAVGVGWTFPVLREEYPTAPDETLDDAQRWWDQLASEPRELLAVRDLDLVDDWDAALTLLAEIPHALDDPEGYTAWWLRTHTRLGRLRPPDDETFVGLLDACTHPAADRLTAALLTRVRTAAQAQVLADALADPERTPSAGVITAAHEAIAGHELERLPDRVRTVDGELIDADAAAVLDAPHLRFVGGGLVFGGLAAARELAQTLDLPLAGQRRYVVVSRGERYARGVHPQVTLAQALGELPDAREVEVHTRLAVEVANSEVAVPYWYDDGVLHVERDRW